MPVKHTGKPMDEPLITKYRPKAFSEVLGHDEMMAKLQRRLESDNPPHAYLLTGPSGIGKTTVARIIGNHLGAEIEEIDAGASGSIDMIRELIDNGQHLPLSGAKYKMYIIDECHGLSAPAKQAVLKILEEPPEHLFFALCTTEAHRIPETWKTRCFPVALKPVARQYIEELLQIICETEGWKPSADIMALLVEEATGQPRKAITLLERCYDTRDRAEAKRIISILDADSDALGEIAALLIQGRASWEQLRPLFAKLEEGESYDGLLVPLTRRIIGALLRETGPQKARVLGEMIKELTFPTQTFDPKAQFYAALARIVWPI
jgi:DNA polymerase III subunit gamma/tau